jgi:uncharacterized protein (DUF2147 family)
MRLFFIVTCFVLFQLGSLFGQNADAILGIWVSEKKDGKIEVYKVGDQFLGKIVWTKGSGYVDEKNPDPKLRSRPILGMLILTGLKSKGNNKWDDGQIYDPESGKTYSCSMKLKDKLLEIRGYIGISLFGRSSVWTRE